VANEADCLRSFQDKLESAGVMTRQQMQELEERYTQEMLEMSQKVREEALPDPSTIYDHTYYGQKGRYW
jgi:TPP-dependent pyruvate/acetoin dehydrogenase alpha subunit